MCFSVQQVWNGFNDFVHRLHLNVNYCTTLSCTFNNKKKDSWFKSSRMNMLNQTLQVVE